jgi:transposase-like protein
MHNAYRRAGEGREIDREKATRRTVRGIVAEASTREALALMREGVSQAEAARRVGVNARTLRRRLVEIAEASTPPASTLGLLGQTPHVGLGDEATPVACLQVGQGPGVKHAPDGTTAAPGEGSRLDGAYEVGDGIPISHTCSIAPKKARDK